MNTMSAMIDDSRHVQQLEETVTTSEDSRDHAPLNAKERAILCARAAADNRGRDIVVLDMTQLVTWVDYTVVATGSSRRQISTIADKVEDAMADVGDKRIGIEGYDLGQWVVLDYGDVLIHIFDESKRDFYQLEHLWGDAPHVKWQRPEDFEHAETAHDEAVDDELDF